MAHTWYCTSVREGEGVGLRIYKFHINDLPRGTLDGDQRAVCGFERRKRRGAGSYLSIRPKTGMLYSSASSDI
jgi:hypothetical protein